MNTSAMASKLTGLSFTLFPVRRNGEAFMKAYAQLNVTSIQELQPFEAGDSCDTLARDPASSGDVATILRTVDWNELCCELSMDWDMLEPTINRTTAYVKVTDPTRPDFLYNLAFSLVNETVQYRVPGTPNTGGQDFYLSYSEFSTKLNMDLVNWPWVGRNLTGGDVNPSYLKFFFVGVGVVEEPGNITVWDKGLSIFYSAKTSRSYVELDFLKVVNTDGVDHAISLAEPEEPITAEGLSVVGVPFTITVCQDKKVIDPPYWTNLTYDPTLTALYDDPTVPEEAVTPEAAAKRRLPAAAYAVPIAIVVVVLAAVFVVLFVTPVNRAIFGDRSKILRPERALTDEAKAPAPFTQPAQPSAAAAVPSANEPRSSWVRSSKVDH